MQVNIALLTVTDTRTIETDKSGAILVKKIKEQNHKLIDRKLVKDKKEMIKKILRHCNIVFQRWFWWRINLLGFTFNLGNSILHISCNCTIM